MLMNDLLEMRLFRLLSEPSQKVTDGEIGNAYGEFLEHVATVSDAEDKILVFRTLSLTRIEFIALETIYRYGQGKNALKKVYLQKALSLINSEIDLFC